MVSTRLASAVALDLLGCRTRWPYTTFGTWSVLPSGGNADLLSGAEVR